VIRVGGEWYYEEYGPGNSVHGIGLDDPWPGQAMDPALLGGTEPSPPATPLKSDDRRSILDLFRN
jgi:penicillin-binding protein 1A